MAENIFPHFDQMISREFRENKLGQRSKVIWLTGLSGSGKSTIGLALEKRLFQENFVAQLLDGDNIRSGINKNLGFSEEDRKENIRRIAEIAKLYLSSGIITINSFISPTAETRNIAKEIVGDADFLEIYINAPMATCESRDVKGLYKKARAGEIQGFTGVNQSYEEPENPALELRTDILSVDEAVDKLFTFLKKHIILP
ncbi:MAG: adenylyl-sulfate kinase [Saprospiraceae bacterium]|nr:adenylyl-sulfate kinase [Saprospiraceae bacterium]MDP4814253.1 adenylyl-sulfate kinase [Saprospiraceae bacterium]MDP4915729.1 adenylyl-sulfate kinase [Saprospiraceae bacterium]MDP5048583.1 adenylyl-sulfate kinase [Saprospiraceae bacterium]